MTDKKFKKVNGGEEQWVDVTNERFMLWMRAPLRSNFYTLWGIIDQDLDQGMYRIDITNDVTYYNLTLQKSVVLQNLNWMGGYNPWLYYAYFMAAAILLFAGGALMYVRKLEEAETQL